jgi:hypothetical protein
MTQPVRDTLQQEGSMDMTQAAQQGRQQELVLEQHRP